MIFKRKKTQGTVDTEFRYNRSNCLEETLALTLTEVKELRSEITMLRKELLGDKFMESSGSDGFVDAQVDYLPGDGKAPDGQNVMLLPQHQDINEDVQQTDIRNDLSGEADSQSETPTVNVEGWATVDFRPKENRRWWQFWKPKKSKLRANDLDFA